MTASAAAEPVEPASAFEPAEPLGEGRIVTLDVVRGVAVMGILAMNIVAFAMPGAAYMNPMAYGTEGPADLGSWIFSFLFIDGRMRGLFSFLFGASLLLVVERAEAAGLSPARIHYSRMIVLLLFGLIHFYLIWWGDILSLYALVGMLAYLFWRKSPRTLVRLGLLFVALQFVLFACFAWGFQQLAVEVAGPHPSRDAIAQYAGMSEGIATYTPAALQEILARFRGPWWGVASHMLTEETLDPFVGVALFGFETLGYMLLGMAALKTGFLAGRWPRRAYLKAMLIGFGIGVPVYALLAWRIAAGGFAAPDIFIWGIAATVPVRPLMIVATAALVIVLTQRGRERMAAGRPAFVARIAAAGRAAFTNYLGTSILMTGLFYGWGFGLFGHLSRIELWLVVVAMWVLMLLWSKPWLDRFRYGPFEWLWRSLARGRFQPMGKAAEAPEA
jgi:uncharacterized protein